MAPRILLLAALTGSLVHAQGLGLFENHTDIGAVLHPGSATFDPASKTYTVSGSGENVWGAADAFQFVWRKVTGDITISADVAIAGRGGDPHRKAMLMIRQSLAADSPYADIAIHGVGLASLQARDTKGGATHEVQSNLNAPRRARLVKRGPYFYMYLGEKDGEDPQMAGGAARVPIEGEYYVGIGVCAHNKDAKEKAVFSNVELSIDRQRETERYSTLETISVSSGDAHVAAVSTDRLESPNWTRDGKWLLFNTGGRIRRVAVDGGPQQELDTGFAAHCTAFHGLSPDGLTLAFSDESRDRGKSAVYVVSMAGGIPERVTAEAPSEWHAWAPDGKSLLIYAEFPRKIRGLFSIPATGGSETYLGNGTDGEYSPDGKFIYFTTTRSRSRQIWRMQADGKAAEQVTRDEFLNSRPHLSPDGKLMAFLSLDRIKGHDAALRLMTLATKEVRVLARFTGGEGSMDAPDWSPDSRRLAFVSYQTICGTRRGCK